MINVKDDLLNIRKRKQIRSNFKTQIIKKINQSINKIDRKQIKEDRERKQNRQKTIFNKQANKE